MEFCLQHSEGSFPPRILYQTKLSIVCEEDKDISSQARSQKYFICTPFFRELIKVVLHQKWKINLSERPGVQERRDPTRKQAGGVESRRVQGCEGKGRAAATRVVSSSGDCGWVENRLERTLRSLGG